MSEFWCMVISGYVLLLFLSVVFSACYADNFHVSTSNIWRLQYGISILSMIYFVIRLKQASMGYGYAITYLSLITFLALYVSVNSFSFILRNCRTKESI